MDNEASISTPRVLTQSERTMEIVLVTLSLTETQLIVTIDDITRAVDKGKYIHMAILDFSKAFDKVPHERLLGKPEYYGIRNTLQECIRDFLTNWIQRVACEGSISSEEHVLLGVLQGMVIGPLFVSDIHK